MLQDPLFQNWLLQLQCWAADGRLLEASIKALRLDSTPTPKRLNELIHRLAIGDFSNIPPIELLPDSAMPGAAGAYAESTGRVYLNKQWILSTAIQYNFRDVCSSFWQGLKLMLKQFAINFLGNI